MATSRLAAGLLVALVLLGMQVERRAVPATAATSGSYAYVAQDCSATYPLSVVNTASNSLTTSIPLGYSQQAIVANPTGSRVYVASSPNDIGDWALSAIDTTSNTVAATVPITVTGTVPKALAVNPAATRIYVANDNTAALTSNDSVSVVDVTTNAVLTTIPVARGPLGLAVDPTGSRVYVTHGDNNTALSVIDAASNSVLTSMTLGSRLWKVVVNPTGTRLYITDVGADALLVVDTTTYAVIASIPMPGATGTFNDLHLAINAVGTRVYVTSGNTLAVVDTATNAIVATIPAVSSFAIDVALDASGAHAYVTNGNQSLSVVDTATNTVTTTVSGLSFCSTLVAIAGPPIAATLLYSLAPGSLPSGELGGPSRTDQWYYVFRISGPAINGPIGGSNGQGVTLQPPNGSPQIANWGRTCDPNVVYVEVNPAGPSGIYTLTLPLPSGPTVTTTFQHPGTPVASAPPLPCAVGTAIKLAFTQELPATATAGQPFAVQPKVTVEDANGNLVTSYSGTVTLSKASSSTGTGNLTCTGGPGPNQQAVVQGVAAFFGCAFDQTGSYVIQASSGTLAPALTNTITVNSPSCNGSSPTSISPSRSASVPSPSVSSGEASVAAGLRPGADAAAIEKRVGAVEVDSIPDLNAILLDATPGHSIDSMLSALNAEPGVEYAERLHPLRLDTVPNDPCYPQQWAPRIIGAPTAWDTTTGSSSLVMAFIDSGIDTSHPDLQGRIDPASRCFLKGCHSVNDDYGHGTGMAGIAAAATNNGIGIAGLTWQGKILALKVVEDPQQVGNDGTLAKAIEYADKHGAKVINLSLSIDSTSCAKVLAKAVAKAQSDGVLLVAASGNAPSAQGGPVQCPANLPGVMAVTATYESDTFFPYSDSGPEVAVAAPGWEILSTVPTGACELCDPSGYLSVGGTSPAAASVTGLAALVWSANSGLTAAQVRDVIEQTAVDLGPSGRDNQFGCGRINAAAAVAKAKTPSPQPSGGC